MTINMDLVFRRSRIDLEHFHPENDPEKEYPQNPVDPVRKIKTKIESIQHYYECK